MLHAQEQRGAGVRREAPVEEPPEPGHVEQHVDRDHEQQDGREDPLPDGDRRALGEVDDVLRVLADVALAYALHELVAFLLHLERLQVVRVEPDLQPIDVAIGLCLAGLSVPIVEIPVEPVRGRL